MRGTLGDETLLTRDHRVEAFEHAVKRGASLREFVVGPSSPMRR